MAIFLFDIGGTNMRFAVTEDCIECTEPKVIETPETYEESLDLIEQAKQELAGEREITAAVGGIAGTFDKDRHTLHFSPNNPDWVDQPVRDHIAERVGARTFVDNDTAVIALGEAAYGAGKGAEIVAYMTVSTGVGGSRVINGEPDHKARTFEPGHQVIHPPTEDRSLDDLHEWTLENLVSGTAMERRFGDKAYNITDEAIWKQVTDELAVGVYNTLLHWSPDIIVLGGAMITGSPCIPFDDLCENVKTLSPTLFDTCTIVQAELGDLNGLYGAMAWSKQLHN